ncbi:DUF3558 family protein [Nocardia sp. NPDC004068]|uniref:DUF3558 family protein n=1 Tax=Nocardia sp. NPDC004068 TaxID=3364303 RepID=UPI00368D9C26
MTRKTFLTQAAAVIVALTCVACGSGGQTAAPPAPPPNGLDGCGPLPPDRIAAAAGIRQARQLTAPTVCAWTGESTLADGGAVDITYGWLRNNSLLLDRDTAAALGYRTENTVTASFGGFYWHDPRDPGACGVSAADSGTVTWWIRHRDHSARPDPCAAAWQLTADTVKLDG